MAEQLAAAGAAVVLAARTEAEIEAAAAAVRAAGAQAVAVRCDITDDASVAELVEQSQQALGGPIDTLVNNAGRLPPPGLPRLHARRLALDARRQRRGDGPGHRGVPAPAAGPAARQDHQRVVHRRQEGTYGQAAYNASKHAQIGLTRCLALETGTTGLRVNAVCPGFTKTDLIDLDELGRAHGKPGADVWSTVEQAATIKRTVTLDEIAAAVVYLASPAADGVNGQSLVVDGGIVMS